MKEIIGEMNKKEKLFWSIFMIFVLMVSVHGVLKVNTMYNNGAFDKSIWRNTGDNFRSLNGYCNIFGEDTIEGFNNGDLRVREFSNGKLIMKIDKLKYVQCCNLQGSKCDLVEYKYEFI